MPMREREAGWRSSLLLRFKFKSQNDDTASDMSFDAKLALKNVNGEVKNAFEVLQGQ